MPNDSDLDESLESYFSWVDFFLKYDRRQSSSKEYNTEQQSRYLKDSFNTLAQLNWKIEAAGIVVRADDRKRFPYYLEHEDELLVDYLQKGIGRNKKISDDRKITHFLRYLSRFKDKHLEIAGEEIPFYELNFKSVVDAYLYWKIHNKKPPEDVKEFLFE